MKIKDINPKYGAIIMHPRHGRMYMHHGHGSYRIINGDGSKGMRVRIARYDVAPVIPEQLYVIVDTDMEGLIRGSARMSYEEKHDDKGIH